MASWFRSELRPFVNDVLCGENLRPIGIFDLRYIDEIKRQHFDGVRNHAYKLWGLMNLVAWHKQVLIGCRAAAVRV